MSRNKIRNEQIKDERREQILTEALRLFAVKGLAAVRASDISAATGISQGLVYHYFKSKEEIFTTLVSRAIQRMNDAATGLESASIAAADKLRLAVTELLKGISSTDTASTYYFLVTQAALSEAAPEEARAFIRDKNQVKYEIIRRILEAGQAEGTVKDFNATEMAEVFWSIINGLALRKAINPILSKPPDVAFILTIFLK